MRKLALLAILLVMVTWSCASQQIEQSYKTLAISKTTYDTTLTMAGDLYRQGAITEQTKEQAIKYGTVFMLAHNQAVVALLEFQAISTKEAGEKANATLLAVSSALSRLLDFLEPYIAKGVPK